MLSLFKRRRAPATKADHLAPQNPPEDHALKAAEDLVASLYSPAPLQELCDAVNAAGFAEDDYFLSNPDLQTAFPSSRRAFLHFLAMVKIERRRFPIRLRLSGMQAIHGLRSDDRTIVSSLLASLADAASNMGPAPELEKLQENWRYISDFRPLGAQPYIVAGDSHSTFYRRSTAIGDKWLLPLHVCCSGGSALGLGNPESRAGYGQQLRNVAAQWGLEETIPLFLQFGQVDLEFVHPFRRVRDGATCFSQAEFGAFCTASVEAYVSFLNDLIAPERRGGVVILGVFPPALKDAPLRQGYINDHITYLEGVEPAELKARLARLDWPDLPARTLLHAAYNDLLEAAVTAAGFHFVSDFGGLLSRDGVLDERFIANGKGLEHHLDFIPSETLLSNTIWRLADPTRPIPKIRYEDLSEIPGHHLLPPLDQPGAAANTLSADQRSWVQDGVVIKKNFLPDDVLDPYIHRRAAFRPGTAWNAVGWPDGNCYEGVAELRDVALYPPLMALLEQLMGEPMLLHLALTGWLSTERDWHQDDYLNPPFINTWYAAVWIALDTITPQSGPFEYVPGSHRWPLLRGEKVKRFLTEEELGRRAPTTKLVEWPKYAERFVSPAIEDKIAESGLPVVPFLAEKGDLLVWHSRLMHRGSKRLEEWDTVGDKVYSKHPRKALITHYSGINHRPDMHGRARDVNGQSFAVFKTELILE